MRLTKLVLSSFRCFESTELDLDEPLILFVGDNDAGKSSLLDAISVACFQKELQLSDIREASDIEKRCSVEAIFVSDSEVTHIRRSLIGGSALSETKKLCLGEEYDEFPSLPAAEQKRLLLLAGEEPSPNKPGRIEQYQVLEGGSPHRTLRWKPIVEPPSELGALYVDRTSAQDFTDPAALVSKVLANSIRQTVSRYFTEHPDVLVPLRELIKSDSEQRAQQLQEHLQLLLPTLVGVDIDPYVDFRNPAIKVALKLDLGTGSRVVDAFGDGTARRTWIAVQKAAANWGGGNRVMRLYDEPDAQLDFRAQRELFSQIRTWSEHASTAQTFVCTHAVTLIDRCSPRALRLVARKGRGPSEVHRLGETEGDFEMMEELGQFSGVRNLSILYERAFLLVEGPTEVKALTEVYRRVHGRSLETDGIRLVDLQGCGAWPSVVMAIGRIRRGLVHLLLDADCEHGSISSKLSDELLERAHLSSSDVTLIGTKEFEDAFADDDWLHLLSTYFPRADGEVWMVEHLRSVRSDNKFSSAMVRLIQSAAEPQTRSNATKPHLGYLLGQSVELSRLPPAIQTVLSILDEKRLDLSAQAVSVP